MSKINEIIDLVKELSVVELAELVSTFEEEFGVSAAAPVAVAAAGGGAAAEEKKLNLMLNLLMLVHLRSKLSKLFVNLQVLVLKKRKISLMAHQKWLKKVSLKKMLKQQKRNWKKLALLSPLSNFTKGISPSGEVPFYGCQMSMDLNKIF